MKYPIFIRQTSKKTVFGMCPIFRDFYAEGTSVENVIRQLNDKFLCFLHDDNIELEIIPVDGTNKEEEIYDASKNG